MKILHKIEDQGFYVDNNSNVLDLDEHFIYCYIHIDQRLYLNYKGFIYCNECNKEVLK